MPDISYTLRSEFLRIPFYLWGGFFPIHVAIWRFLHASFPEELGTVHAEKDTVIPAVPTRIRITDQNYSLNHFAGMLPDDWSVDGYRCDGHGVARLLDLLWSDGPIFDAVEEIAYYTIDKSKRELGPNDCIAPDCLAKIPDSVVTSLGEACKLNFNRNRNSDEVSGGSR